MSRGRTPEKVDEGRAEGASTPDRTFGYALFIYAVVEFIAIALILYYKVRR
jgi:large-conductance mechanosensitive channel